MVVKKNAVVHGILIKHVLRKSHIQTIYAICPPIVFLHRFQHSITNRKIEDACQITFPGNIQIIAAEIGACSNCIH